MKTENDMLNGKDEAAVSLGRRGGLARAKALTKERRKEIASNAAKARWKRKMEKDQHSVE